MSEDDIDSTSDAEGAVDARVLLVEDDRDDVYVVERVLSQAPIQIHVDVRDNGQSGLEFLKSCLEKNGPPLPDLILLDLNMPVMDGYSFLREIRSNAALSSLPVCVLTTSNDEELTKRAYDSGANAVVSKVDTLEGMSSILNTIVDFWFKTAQRYYI